MTTIKLFSALTTSSVLAFGFVLPVAAQEVIPDGTTSTTVDVDGTINTINDGDRAGGNLFHSFQEFSVPDGGTAFFNNALDIVNIFSRVTGGDISSINGLLGANGTANLFLINPAGIIFGENAQLSIGGSFFGSTADSIVFSDGEFSALDADNPPLLTVNAPLGLGIRDNPAEIVNGAADVGLEVDAGQTLALVGGNINFEGGQITAPGANVWLGGLSAAGTVSITDGFDLSIPEGIARADISFSDGAGVNTAGDNGGGITVIGNSITLSEASQLFGGIAADSGFDGAQAGDINVDATGAVNLSGESNILNQVNGGAIGNSGDINVTAQSLTLTEGSSVSASTSGQGDAGTVRINAAENIFVDGEDPSDDISVGGIFSAVGLGGVGNAEGVEITTANLTLTNAGTVSASTFGQGDAGTVTINASDTISVDGSDLEGFPSGIFSDVNSNAVGNAGGVEITTRNLTLTNGGEVLASTFGRGNAGTVTINASDTISADGENLEGFNSSIRSDVNSDAVGDAGGVTINTGSLSLTNGGIISAGTFGQGNAGSVNITATDTVTFDGEDSDGFNSGAFSTVQSDALGNAGGVNITTGSLALINEGTVNTSTFSQGNGGGVTINARESVLLDDGDIFSEVNSDAVGNAGTLEITTVELSLINSSLIGTRVFGEGDGGSIMINTDSLSLLNGSEITASTFGRGNAGTVTIDASGTISADGEDSDGFNSSIRSDVNSDALGDAGGVTINTGTLSLTNGGLISADTFGQGNAGSVEINASDTINIDGEDSDGFLSEASSSVNSDAVGDAGGVTITTGSLNLTNGGRVIADTFGQGNAGSIEITASDTINIDGEDSDGIPSEASSSVNSDAVGDAGGVTIITGSLNLTNGGRVIADTSGQGNAGLVEINASNAITIDGENSQGFGSGIFSEVNQGAKGNGGGIEVTTNKLEITSGAAIDAGTFGEGDGGNISVTANEIFLDGTTPDGSSGGIGSEVNLGARGNGGEISVQTINLSITNGATISASSFGEGNGGNITVTADNLNLDSGSISASNQPSTNEELRSGGNITLQVEDNLILRNNSTISAEATNNANGGNINIDAGFIIGFPSRGLGSDIRANAGEGAGGNINIQAQGVLGLEESRDTAGDLNNTNDIDASSEFGLDGAVNINFPDVNPLQGLNRLPTNPVSADTISSEACSPRGGSTSLIFQGKGGIPPQPTAPLPAESLIPDGKPITLDKDSELNSLLVEEIEQEQKDPNAIPDEIKPVKTDNGDIYPARGVIVREDGTVTLTTYPTDNKNNRIPQTSVNCNS